MINQKKAFQIKSKIFLQFTNNTLCEIAYKSYIPEFKESSKRSKITLQMKDKDLIYTIKSKDITAFRAALNEIVSFGKIFEKSVQLI
jgi:tRNA threonylcarbamoyladenosine modification (KEOPS) complex  Pcc1 subunit